MADFTKTWDFTDILDIDTFEQEYTALQAKLDTYKEWFEKVNPEMPTEQFLEYLEFANEFSEHASKVMYIGHLMLSVDQKSDKARLCSAKSDTLGLEIEDATRSLSHWLMGKDVEGKQTLDDENAKRLFDAAPDYKYKLNKSRLAAKHALSEDKEELISKKDVNGVQVVAELRDMVETDFTFEVQLEDDKPAQVFETTAELRKLFISPNPDIRKKAYDAMYAKYKNHLDTFFVIYQAIVRDYGFEAKLRGFESPIAVKNFGNGISDKAVKALIATCNRNAPVFQEYFKFKAKELGVEKLRRYDIYAPLQDAHKEYDFEHATQIVFDTFESFDPKFKEYAKKLYDQNHVDSHPNKVKRGGAFCATVCPSVDPYVLLNHTGTSRDVQTLAHELGHAIHSMLANHLPNKSQHASLPLAETASTFGEMIVFEALLKDADSDAERKAMLADKISDMYATIMRQIFFVQFEIKAHEALQQGITKQELSALWLETLQTQFGDTVDELDIFQYEWACIPHIFHTPFYCYSYSFGLLLSLALYDEYKHKGKDFIPTLEKILSAGGSRDPKELLAESGIDIESEEFWQKGFDLIKQYIEQLKSY